MAQKQLGAQAAPPPRPPQKVIEVDRRADDTIEFKPFAALDIQQLHEAKKQDQYVAEGTAHAFKREQARAARQEAVMAERQAEAAKEAQHRQNQRAIQRALQQYGGAQAGGREAEAEAGGPEL